MPVPVQTKQEILNFSRPISPIKKSYMDRLAFPDPNRACQLTAELTKFFAGLPYVARILLFGSLARNTDDRWSDIDLLVVTRSTTDRRLLYNDLRKHKPMMYHHPFTPYVEPSGGNLLGTVFFDESVFHNLDLNFLSQTEYENSEALKRFGLFQELYVCESGSFGMTKGDSGTQSPTHSYPIDEAEERIEIALHWTKKAVKKFLRGTGSQEELLKTRSTLKQVLQGFPNGLSLPNGDICQLAYVYINIAEHLLASQGRSA